MKPHLMETATGRIVDAFDLRAQDINRHDIAFGLANTCRWGGQTRRWFSVAQHSVWAAWVADQLCFDGFISSYALLHDAHEAYMGDIIVPNRKRLFVTTGGPTDYARTFESRESEAFRVICSAFGLPYMTVAQAELVEICDRVSQLVELDAIGRGKSDWVKPMREKYGCYLDSVDLDPHDIWDAPRSSAQFLLAMNQCEL